MDSAGNSIAARAKPFLERCERPAKHFFACEGFKAWCSGSFLHAAQADAGRANTYMFRRAIDQRVNPLQVRIPPSPPCIVRVADYVAVVRPFAA
jgi:hypothetical protein